jgi:predicted nucleic acid-binding protein
MSRILVDSNVLLDVFEDDADWADWSESMLDYYRSSHILCINPVIYAEISIGFQKIEEVEKVIFGCALVLENIPREALFLAGKAFLKYRKRQGSKVSPLPDFFIGAHATVARIPLLTRDVSRYRTYFPRLRLIAPDE